MKGNTEYSEVLEVNSVKRVLVAANLKFEWAFERGIERVYIVGRKSGCSLTFQSISL